MPCGFSGPHVAGNRQDWFGRCVAEQSPCRFDHALMKLDGGCPGRYREIESVNSSGFEQLGIAPERSLGFAGAGFRLQDEHLGFQITRTDECLWRPGCREERDVQKRHGRCARPALPCGVEANGTTSCLSRLRRERHVALVKIADVGKPGHIRADPIGEGRQATHEVIKCRHIGESRPPGHKRIGKPSGKASPDLIRRQVWIIIMHGVPIVLDVFDRVELLRRWSAMV